MNSADGQFTSTVIENFIAMIMEILKINDEKARKVASIAPWLALNPWNYSQHNKLQQQLRESLQSLDSFLQQLQQTMIFVGAQQNASQGGNQDLLKMLDYDACK